ncbi:MAG: hypothetical protein ACTSUX_05410 [Promethearchaeota archaeon]
MPDTRKDVLDYRKRIYFDCICGVICAIISLGSAFYFTSKEGIYNITIYMISLVFWLFWLALSLFLIFMGLYTYYLEKKYPEGKKTKKKLRPPIIS